MKAWVLHDIGNFRYEERCEPQATDDEVVVAVKAAGICGSDIPRVYQNGAHRMPLIPGHEFAGEVVKTGDRVDQSWTGKRVGVFPLIPCRSCKPCLQKKYEMCRKYSYLGSRRDGAFAQYVAVPEWNLLELPDGVSFEEAAMMEPMAVAVHAMRRVNPSKEDTVVVCGLGSIGQLLTMFLSEQGVGKLLLIGNKEFQKKSVLKLGISEEYYCDCTRQDVKKWILEHTDGYGADVFFECVGKNESVAQAIGLTAPSGRVCMVGNPYSDIRLSRDIYWKILRHQLSVTGTWNSSYLGNGQADQSQDDWQYVLDKLEQGRIAPSALISHRLPMDKLEQGFHIMRDKTEDYIKIMMTD